MPTASGVSGNLLTGEQYTAGLLDGYAEEYDVGLDRIKVGGVENEIKFNGNTINKSYYNDAVIVTSIDGLADPDVRDSRAENPGYDGETAFRALYGGRTIVLSGFIRAGTLSKLRDMQDGLKATFAPLDEKQLIFKSTSFDKSLSIYCRKSQPITMGEVQEGFQFKRDFQITLRASNFEFVSSKLHSVFWQNSTDPSDASQTPTAFYGEKNIGDIVNLGNYLADTLIKVEGPLIATASGTEALIITNDFISQTSIGSAANTSGAAEISNQALQTGLDISKNNLFTLKAKSSATVLTSTEYFLIDSKNRSIKKYNATTDAQILNANNKPYYYDYLDVSSEWIKLAPGSNPIKIEAIGPSSPATSNPKITIFYRHTFI